ncbi:MAG: prepilin-type N-terminal cleavage/methylation domain-containing protein [Sedimentisphaerales bacterium]|nr:prepilin-type N-terminal cleavage/methylation domain-containing protein [Sedimentisphaerales bacterium]
MRKGYSLIEMIVTIALLVMLMPIFDRFFKVIAFELPRDSWLVNESIVLLNAVKNIRSDVAEALALSQEAGDSNEPSSLVIKLANGVVSYNFKNGRLIRRQKDADRETIPDDTTWSLPHGIIEMQVSSAKHKAGAVELVTGLEYWDNGKPRRKMANSYVFFAGVAGRPTQ